MAVYLCKSYHLYYRWEDSLNNGTGGRSFSRSNNIPPSNSNRNSGRGSRGRGRQNASNSSNGTFVSATGDPVSGRRCFVCGDPSHFANVCPNRGAWCLLSDSYQLYRRKLGWASQTFLFFVFFKHWQSIYVKFFCITKSWYCFYMPMLTVDFIFFFYSLIIYLFFLNGLIIYLFFFWNSHHLSLA